MLFALDDILFASIFALILDAIFGDPAWLYKHVHHPIAIMGHAVARLENRSFGSIATAKALLRRGRVTTIALVLVAAAIGSGIQWLCLMIPHGWIFLGILMSTLIAQKSLADHVAAVGLGLDQGLEQGRAAVAHIVSRDTDDMDEHGVARAAVESLAENFSDGVVAPVFWGLLLGLPGMLAYKMINTADSMIGYRSERYLHFGRFAAKLDDVVNWLPARLAAFLILAAARLMPGALFGRSWQAIGRDARYHRSPNAGWPEAAMAGALDLKIAGPRQVKDKVIPGHWMGDGRPDLTSRHIRSAIQLFWWSSGILFMAVSAFLPFAI